MNRADARKEICRLRRKMEEELNTKQTHFAMHLVYINYYDELEQITRNIIKHIPE